MIDRIKCKNNLLNVLSEKCENEPDLNGVMKLESFFISHGSNIAMSYIIYISNFRGYLYT